MKRIVEALEKASFLLKDDPSMSLPLKVVSAFAETLPEEEVSEKVEEALASIDRIFKTKVS